MAGMAGMAGVAGVACMAGVAGVTAPESKLYALIYGIVHFIYS